eukprot:CAMPEP_0171641358 /NCGR_PEP_ID=MMETSP0990-20121206/31164_1 /TAXON_ID=483369 /ORGANISM="non described non described, Strain CCMP2098" /LENGTH=46 /DNA_ID= /DNA_START= /DNA_END= /DNA_ORIENTATION=
MESPHKMYGVHRLQMSAEVLAGASRNNEVKNIWLSTEKSAPMFPSP